MKKPSKGCALISRRSPSPSESGAFIRRKTSHRTQEYIETVYGEIGLDATTEAIPVSGSESGERHLPKSISANVLRRYCLGLTTDWSQVRVGADDNASRRGRPTGDGAGAQSTCGRKEWTFPSQFVSFERFGTENPAFATPTWGARCTPERRRAEEKIDG